MISYMNPICAVTNNRATLFCCAEGCTQPAFACSTDCLIEKEHINHNAALWSSIEESVRQAMEITLSKEELTQLEKQEKLLKIIAEEIKVIMDNHEKLIVQCKKRLKLKKTVQKVFQAILNKTTHSVMGGDMANLIEAIKTNDLFHNTKVV